MEECPPSTSAVATSLPSKASIMSDIINASSDMVGEAVSAFVYSFFWGLPSAQVLPLIFPHHFSFINVSASRFCCVVSVLVLIAPNMFSSKSCENSANIASIARCPNCFIPALAVICVKHTFAISLWHPAMTSSVGVKPASMIFDVACKKVNLWL